MPPGRSLQTPSFRVDGMTALITGAGTGLGAGAAVALAQAGAEVILLGRTESTLAETAEQIHATGGVADVIVCDVCDRESVRDRIAGLKRLDILVNNAGVNHPQPFTEVSDERLDQIVNLNVLATFVVAQAATRKMLEAPDRKERGGAVINMSSQMGHVGAPTRTVYCMSKHAIEGLTKAMAVELAEHGIRVNSICPTFTDTPLVRWLLQSADRRDEVISHIPMGRMGKVEDVMAAVVYLASPAAAMITGTHLIIDGGWTAQ